MRYEVPNKSSCIHPPYGFSNNSGEGNVIYILFITTPFFKLHLTDSLGCWLQPTFKKAIILLIDALRFDFVVYPEGENGEANPYHHNQLPVFKELLEREAEHSFLFQFIADSPTGNLHTPSLVLHFSLLFLTSHMIYKLLCKD